MMQLMIQPMKRLLPKSKRYRKLRLGPAAGCMMAVDLRHDLKAFVGLYEYELLPHMKRMVKAAESDR
jgi:hypothetical protein